MAKNSIRDYSATNSDNTDIQSIDIGEGCSPAGINNAIREVMADTADFVSGTVGIDVLSLTDDANTYAMKFQAPTTLTATATFTLPDGDGTDGQAILTDGAGTLRWGAVGDTLTGIQTFTADGTYTPSTGVSRIIVIVTGGGGSGSGYDATSASARIYHSGGGGAGSTAIKNISGVTSGYSGTVTIGSGGAGVNDAGSNGGTSSFADGTNTLSATGGLSSARQTNTVSGGSFGGNGGTATGGALNIGGGAGDPGIGVEDGVGIASGAGGSSYWGGGGRGGARGSSGIADGGDGTAHGSGGGGGAGAHGASGSVDFVGGAGADGIVVVYEYL